MLLAEPGARLDNDPAINLVSRLGYNIPRNEYQKRLCMMMWVENGIPQLGAETKAHAADFEKINKTTLEGFSLLPKSELDIFVEGQVIYNGVTYHFDRSKDDMPYAHRLLHISDSNTGAVKFQENRGTIHIGEAPSAAKPIFFDPIRVVFSDENRLNELQNLEGMSQSKCCLLPPTCTSFDDLSYFNKADSKLRSGLLKLIKELSGPVSMAQALVELQQYPLLRDLLAEGAILDVDFNVDSQTFTHFTIADNKHPVAAYRRKFLQGNDGNLNQLANDVGNSLLSDIVARVEKITYSGAVPIRTHTKTQARKTVTISRSSRGTWNRLNKLKQGLGNQEDRKYFVESILEPYENSDDKRFNHSGAEDAFLAHCWRYPGAPGTSADSDISDAWRACLEKLLLAWEDGRHFNYADYLSRKVADWPRLKAMVDNTVDDLADNNTANKIYEFVYSKLVADPQLELDTWKYLLPAGSRLVAGGMVVLDDSVVCLDDGYALA